MDSDSRRAGLPPPGDLGPSSREKAEPDECPTSHYLSLEHIESHTGQILGSGRASEVKSTKSVFRSGDVLYGRLRPYLNKVCIPDFDGVCSTDILVFRKAGAADNRFLMRFLAQREVVDWANQRSKGNSLPRVSFDDLGQFIVALPPLPEQKRIVAKVEELLARVTTVKERLTRVLAIIKHFRQSVLAAACFGRLTEDWRDRNKKVAIPGDLMPDVAVDSTLRETPGTWQWTRLGSLGADPRNPIQTGPFGAQLHRNEFVVSGVPVVAVGTSPAWDSPMTGSTS